MANYNIPGLRQQRNSFFWEPSSTLARAGWDRLVLGNDEAKAIVQAQARVAQVEAWRAAGKPAIGKGGVVKTPSQKMAELTAPILPGRGITLERLIREYEIAGYPRADDPYSSIAPNSRKLYGYSFRRLIAWAGDMPVANITFEDAKAFNNLLITGKTKAIAQTIINHAKRLFNWALDETRLGVTDNPFLRVKSAKTKPRRQVWDTDRTGNDYELIAEACAAIGRPELVLAIDLYLALGQRTVDMIHLSADDWRPIHGLDPHLVEAFAADDGPNAGEVMGFHMFTRKTGTWVTTPIAGALRRRVEAQIARNAARPAQPHRGGKMPRSFGEPVRTILVNEYTGAPWSHSALDKCFADARQYAVETLGLPQFDGLQLRDLRRTGVVRMAERGVPIPQIAAVTGHSLASATTILETYMPRNPTMAAEAKLTMMQADATRDARKVAAKRAAIKVVA
jgi:hypothetical protein